MLNQLDVLSVVCHQLSEFFQLQLFEMLNNLQTLFSISV